MRGEKDELEASITFPTNSIASALVCGVKESYLLINYRVIVKILCFSQKGILQQIQSKNEKQMYSLLFQKMPQEIHLVRLLSTFIIKILCLEIKEEQTWFQYFWDFLSDNKEIKWSERIGKSPCFPSNWQNVDKRIKIVSSLKAKLSTKQIFNKNKPKVLENFLWVLSKLFKFWITRIF